LAIELAAMCCVDVFVNRLAMLAMMSCVNMCVDGLACDS
jgi:hypothetical protein